MTVKRHRGHDNFYKRKHLIGADSLRGLVHYHHGGKHGGTRADMITDGSASRFDGSRKREMMWDSPLYAVNISG